MKLCPSARTGVERRNPPLSEGYLPACTQEGRGKPSKARRPGLAPRQGKSPLSRDRDCHPHGPRSPPKAEARGWRPKARPQSGSPMRVLTSNCGNGYNRTSKIADRPARETQVLVPSRFLISLLLSLFHSRKVRRLHILPRPAVSSAPLTDGL